MKPKYPTLTAIALSAVFTLVLELGLVSLFSDHTPCFFHNSTLGNMVALILRLVVFTIGYSLCQVLFLPSYKTVKDRLLEKEEAEAKENAVPGNATPAPQFSMRD